MKFLLNRCLSLLIIIFISTSHAGTSRKSIVIDDAYLKTKSSIISGHFKSTLDEPAIKVLTSNPVTIRGAFLEGPGVHIYGKDANITVIDTIAVGENPNVKNVQKGVFIRMDSPKNLRVEHCIVSETGGGIYVTGYSGNYSSKNTIKILNNQFYDLEGRGSDGLGNYLSGNWSSSAISLFSIIGVPEIEISGNEVINKYNTYLFGLLDLLWASGTNENPIKIHDNFLQGAYGPFGAITIRGNANDSPKATSSFIDVYNNHIVRAVNNAIKISAGHDNNIYNNRIVSSGFSENGIFIAGYTAIGLVNKNESNQPTTTYFNNHMHDNVVGFMSWTKRNDWDLTGQDANVENNQHWLPNDNSNPSIADEVKEYSLWKEKWTE